VASLKLLSRPKQIALLTHTGRVPESVLQDLSDARRVQLLKNSIAASSDQVKEVLGHFYESYATDFQRVDNAVEMASEILRSYGSARLPPEVADLFSYGSTPPPAIKQVSRELSDSLSEWIDLLAVWIRLYPQNVYPPQVCLFMRLP